MRRLIPLVVLTVVLTGCKVKVDQGFQLNADGSGTATIVLGFDQELMDSLGAFAPAGEDPLDSMTTDLPAGWDSQDWSEGEFTGIQASTDFASLAELRSLAQTVFSGEDGLFETFVIEETSDGGFRYEAAMSGETLEAGMEGLEGFDLGGSIEELGNTFFNAEVTAKFPGDVVSHNADRELSDGTLVWTVSLTDSGRVMRAESAAGGGLPLIPIAAAVAVVLLAAIGYMLWKGRSTSVAEPEGEVYAAPINTSNGDPVDGDPFG